MSQLIPYKKRQLTCSTLAVFLMLFYCYNYTMANIIYRSKVVIVASFLLCVILCALPLLRKWQFIFDRWSVMWMIGLVMAIIYNQRLAAFDFAPKMFCWFAMVACMLLLRDKESWIPLFMKWIPCYTLIHVFFAWLFKFVPSLFYATVGLYDTATQTTMLTQYQSGYLLGLTTHYSTLTTYLGNGLVVFWALFLMEKKRQKKLLLLAAIAVTGITLAMSGKRGMLVFAAMTIVVYSILTRAKNLRKALPVIMKYALVGIACIVVLLILAFTVMPQLLVTVERFISGTEGTDFTSGRSRMWKLALDLFIEKPLFGIGWFGYREAYSTAWHHGSVFQYLDTHNIYLQLLCETGIVGFLIFTAVMFTTFWWTIKDLRKCIFVPAGEKAAQNQAILAVSASLQLLFLMYGLTGNPLYDPQCFIVYFLSIAAAYLVHQRIRKDRV